MRLFDKVKGLAGKHADKVEDAIDKAADVVDDKTGGRYAEQIDKGAEAAKDFVAGDGEHVAVADAGSEPGSQEPPSRLTP